MTRTDALGYFLAWLTILMLYVGIPWVVLVFLAKLVWSIW